MRPPERHSLGVKPSANPKLPSARTSVTIIIKPLPIRPRMELLKLTNRLDRTVPVAPPTPAGTGQATGGPGMMVRAMANAAANNGIDKPAMTIRVFR